MKFDELDQVVPYETRDGSITLYDKCRDIHYRSWHGAIRESRHVFLGATGLLERRGSWRVGELGFGAAVNFVQVVEAFRAAHGVERLEYHSVDWRPVTADHLRFHDGEGGEIARRLLNKVHSESKDAECCSEESDDGRIKLSLYTMPWEDIRWDGLEVQAFFHDPFSKRVNPEAWRASCFERARAAMAADARLATYSAATAVRRAMFAAGLWVASAPGPGRKREITVASRTKADLSGLRLLDRARYLEQR